MSVEHRRPMSFDPEGTAEPQAAQLLEGGMREQITVPSDLYTSHRGSVMATKEGLREVVGSRIDRLLPKAFNYYPLGHRIVLLLDDVPESFESGIHLPEGVRQQTKEQIGAGVVMACGPLVGGAPERSPHPGGPILERPSELLYRHVFFSGFAGQYIKLFFAPKPQWDQWIVLVTDRDLWLYDTSPSSEWHSIG